jgi:hypothetical protein
MTSTKEFLTVTLFGITEGMPKGLAQGPRKDRKEILCVHIREILQKCARKTRKKLRQTHLQLRKLFYAN